MKREAGSEKGEKLGKWNKFFQRERERERERGEREREREREGGREESRISWKIIRTEKTLKERDKVSKRIRRERERERKWI